MTRVLADPQISLSSPWLWVDLGSPHDYVGWPVVGATRGRAQTIGWLQVKNRDLPPDTLPSTVFRRRAHDGNLHPDLGLMTAAEVDGYAISRLGGTFALVTAGLGNGESIAEICRRLRPEEGGKGIETSTTRIPTARVVKEDLRAGSVPMGTVNILVRCAHSLSSSALIEAVSIATEARTMAIASLGLTVGGDPALSISGTGTDCLIIAAPQTAVDPARRYCGLHTALGQTVAAVTYQATLWACQTWLCRHQARVAGRIATSRDGEPV